MDLFYCKIDSGNFGDDMNVWFWDDVMPGYQTLGPDGLTMFGIGSLLWRENMEEFPRILVMGCGAGVGLLPDVTPAHIDFEFVRGPKTAKILGLDPARAIADPACCVSRLDRFAGVATGTGGTVFVPHCGTVRLPVDWARICGEAGVELVSPEDESISVIRRIAGAQLVVTESLHGAIIADAFRVPWVSVAIAPQFSYFKWQDWAAAMEVDFVPHAALKGPKSAYGVIRAANNQFRHLKARLLGKPKVRIAKADNVRPLLQYGLSAEDKGRVRGLISRFSGQFERMMIADLKAAQRLPPRLSRDDVLKDRQDRIFQKIEAVRERFSTS